MDGLTMNPVLDLADMRDIVPSAPRRVVAKISEVKAVVSRFYDVSVEELESPCRKKAFAHPRQIAAALSRELTGASLPMIGRHFGGRDHTTILYAERKIKQRMAANPRFAEELGALRRNIIDIAARRVEAMAA